MSSDDFFDSGTMQAVSQEGRDPGLLVSTCTPSAWHREGKQRYNQTVAILSPPPPQAPRLSAARAPNALRAFHECLMMLKCDAGETKVTCRHQAKSLLL